MFDALCVASSKASVLRACEARARKPAMPNSVCKLVEFFPQKDGGCGGVIAARAEEDQEEELLRRRLLAHGHVVVGPQRHSAQFRDRSAVATSAGAMSDKHLNEEDRVSRLVQSGGYLGRRGCRTA